MEKTIKQIVKKIPFFNSLKNRMAQRRLKAELGGCGSIGRPAPPSHAVKQGVLREYSKRYGLRILVETGTYDGDMVEAMKADFDRIYSIELSRSLYEKAVMRFKGANHIEIIHGDSGNELKRILPKLTQPALFWLDGHYSGGETARGKKDTPINEELNHIFSSKDMGHVVFIDDARLFGKDPAYPSLEELDRYVKLKKPDVNIAVQDDIIRITAKS